MRSARGGPIHSTRGRTRGPLIAAIASSPKSLLGLGGLLVLTFLMGGASRGDALSIVVLRPAVAAFLAFGLWRLQSKDVRPYGFLFGLLLATMVVALLQLIPLPMGWWSALPGRDLVAANDQLAGLAPRWRPLALVPSGAWNAFYAMILPLAVLVLAAPLSGRDHSRLVVLVVALGALSGFLAILQIVGPPDGPMYLYRVTNAGSAVGLFANRNHQATLLATMPPMLTVLVSLARTEVDLARRQIAAGAAVLFLMPLVLVTGSRMGVVVAAIGLASAIWLYRPYAGGRESRSGHSNGAAQSRRNGRRTSIHRRVNTGRWQLYGLIAGVGALLLVGAATVLKGRAEAFQRFAAEDASSEYRYAAWRLIARLIKDYFPTGTGFGSFADVYQIHEPRALLEPTYFNHAHNDWLEWMLTGGLPAAVILFAALAFFLVRAMALVRREASPVGRDTLLARLGLVVILQIAVASVTDYPLRTPIFAALGALAAVWASFPASASRRAVDDKPPVSHSVSD